MNDKFNNLSKKELDILARHLPSESYQFANGKSVTVDQAKEIIRRTDTYFVYDDRSLCFGFDEYWEQQCTLLLDSERGYKYWKHVNVEYILNNWIGNPEGCFRGWIHPNGLIGSRHPIGKVPYGRELYLEWCMIAEAFPFLEMAVSYSDGAFENDRKVMSFLIHNGYVQVVDPNKDNAHEDYPEPPQELKPKTNIPNFKKFEIEKIHPQVSAVPLEWMREWVVLAKKLQKLNVMG